MPEIIRYASELQAFIDKQVFDLENRVKRFIFKNYPYRKGDCVVTESGEEYFLADVEFDAEYYFTRSWISVEPRYRFVGPPIDWDLKGSEYQGMVLNKTLVCSPDQIEKYKKKVRK